MLWIIGPDERISCERFMPPTVLAVLAIVAAHLIGAIPFAYLLVWWARGIDIRTVGSGNVGATNAGRLLGFRFFLLIFALDFLKGFLPTWGLPRLVDPSGTAVPSLPVFVALATILGHNFPVYLRFRGGKGVATSLGALSALDPAASLAAFVGFVACLAVSRYVSLSSVVGGLVFAAAHFTRAADAWSGRGLAMSLATLGLLVMLIYRHRKNFARIAAGTEPKVHLRRPPNDGASAPH
jgi:glycerol-3-phosphate acyltransferase PlsY